MAAAARHRTLVRDAARRRALVRDADVVLLLAVADPWGQFNSFSDPHKIQRYVAAKGAKIVNLSMQDVYSRSNHQDFQRYTPADLSINGDAQSSLAPLTEQVLRLLTPERQRAAQERAAAHGEQARRARANQRAAAARGWDASPVSTARLCMETYEVIKNEAWALVVSDRLPWARSMGPATQHQQFLGGSGGQGVGYGAPSAVGAALANKAKGLLNVTFQPAALPVAAHRAGQAFMQCAPALERVKSHLAFAGCADKVASRSAPSSTGWCSRASPSTACGLLIAAELARSPTESLLAAARRDTRAANRWHPGVRPTGPACDRTEETSAGERPHAAGSGG